MWNDVRKRLPEKSGEYLGTILYTGKTFNDDESDIIEVKDQKRLIIVDFDPKSRCFTTTNSETYIKTKHIVTHWAEIQEVLEKDSDGQQSQGN